MAATEIEYNFCYHVHVHDSLLWTRVHHTLPYNLVILQHECGEATD